jgi:hypothetical protein
LPKQSGLPGPKLYRRWLYRQLAGGINFDTFFQAGGIANDRIRLNSVESFNHSAFDIIIGKIVSLLFRVISAESSET